MLVHDMIRLNAKHRSADIALLVDERRLTYAQLHAESEVVADALVAAGVEKGDRVAVLGRNSLEYVLLYFATAATGSILVPLNFWHRAAEHQHTISDSEPRLLFVEPDLEDQLDSVDTGARVVRFAGAQARGAAHPEWKQFLGAVGPEPGSRPDVAAEDPHMILYTSGTTGRPKGALLSHGRTVLDALGMLTALGAKADDTYLNYFPPFHVGNWDHMKLFFMVGARVVLLRQFDAPEVLRLIEAERATVILGVPTMLHDLLSDPAFESTDTSSIRLLYYGAYDPSGIMRRTAETFGAPEGRIEMAHTLGMTEAGPFITLCRAHEVFDHWGSVGRPVPGVEVELRDDSGAVVGVGEPGEICVRGPMMSGYWRNPQASAETLAGGWLHTGDIAIADGDGFLYIVDRKKDMIRSGGQNVYSKEIEDCLQAHPSVNAAAIIGLPDPRYEERVCAVVVLASGVTAGPAVEDELSAHVRASMAGYNTPREFRFVAELPRNAVGKIQKHVLRDTYGSTFSGSRTSAR